MSFDDARALKDQHIHDAGEYKRRDLYGSMLRDDNELCMTTVRASDTGTTGQNETNMRETAQGETEVKGGND